MGGADSVVEKARVFFDKGDYRWVAQVLNHVIFADPSHAAARDLQADALEQLGYGCESAVWRNMYLMGAHELRRGLAGWGGRRSDRSDYFRAMTSDLLLDYMGIRLNSERAAGKTITANVEVTDTAETFVLELVDSVLVYTAGSFAHDADITLRLTHDSLSFLANTWTEGEELPHGIDCAGERERLTELLSCLDRFDGTFSLAEP
jgi:alkyl sulfatase BDS1-like metallo-beta-lactamase superfamily hydrolase